MFKKIADAMARRAAEAKLEKDRTGDRRSKRRSTYGWTYRRARAWLH